MSLDTFIDLILHVLFTYIAGYIVFKKWNKRNAAFWGAFVGGILIDLDHFIDYFMAYGLRFNVTEFFQGDQFLQANKIFVFFHAWEYLALLIIVLLVVDKRKLLFRSFTLALALSMFLHLAIDVAISSSQLRMYSVGYRIYVNFDLQKLIKEDQYKRIQDNRKQQELLDIR